jgi:hypothetical protein
MAAVAALLSAVMGTSPARSQDLSQVPDSLLNFGYRFTPTFESKSASDVNSISLSGKFSNTIIGSNGLSVNSVLSAGEKRFRTQDRNERDRQLTNSITKLVFPGLTVGMLHSDTRNRSRAFLATGGIQNFVLDTQSVSADARYVSTAALPYGFDARTKLEIHDSQFTFKADKGQGGEANGGVRYRVLDGRVRVQVRGAYKEMSEESSSRLETFGGLGTTSDSTQTLVDVRVADSLDVGVEWTNYDYEREFADLSRTASGAQTAGAENLFLETEKREYRRYGISMTSTPMPRLTLKASAYHTERLTDFVNTPTRFSNNVSDDLSGDLTYRMKSGLDVSLTLKNSDGLRDLGPQSVNSTSNRNKRASLSLKKSFSKTFDASVTLSQSLAQSFYVKRQQNPRDRDQLDSSIKGTITSHPFDKVTAGVRFSIASSEVVSIDSQFSGDNRTRRRYDFDPEFTYTFNERVSVRQAYGLSIEFTDYHYIQEGQDDFIDRSITFRNEIRHKTTKRVSTEFVYSLTLHDRGSFLPEDPETEDPNAPRYLDVEREDRTDRTEIRFRYRLSEHLTLVGEHDYSRRRDTTVGAGQDRISTSGGVEGGVEGNYKWGNRASLVLVFKRAERFSPFSTDAQKRYWDANMAFTYNFM